MNTIRPFRRTLAALALACTVAHAAAPQEVPEVLLRLDDVGMNHSVNMAIEEVARTGIPFSVSVMFACPWYQEAVALLKRHPEISVGVHLTLNSEWRNYRWGPVLGKTAVPSLVDEDGYFLPSTAEFLERHADLGEVERELEAQIDRALASGLRISYIDHHMGTAIATPELRAVLERVSKKYRIGISRHFGETYHTMFDTPIDSKQSAFFSWLASAQPGTPSLVVIHAARRTPEMEVLFDRNNATQNSVAGAPLVALHRQAELDMILSRRFAELLKSGKIKLVTYEQLARRNSPNEQHSPEK